MASPKFRGCIVPWCDDHDGQTGENFVGIIHCVVSMVMPRHMTGIYILFVVRAMRIGINKSGVFLCFNGVEWCSTVAKMNGIAIHLWHFFIGGS